MEIEVAGEISNLDLDCYPVAPPYPHGFGTVCELPTGEITGKFTVNRTISS
jgi:hypothetical protein